MRRRCYLAMLGVIGLCLVGNLIGGEIPSEMLKGHEDAVASIETQGGVYYPVDTRMHRHPSHLDLQKYTGSDYSITSQVYGFDMLTLPAIDGPKLNAINHPDLRMVTFYGGTFSDEEFLAFLSRHPKLEILDFFSPPTNLTSKAFTSLGSLERLDYIQLNNVPITDEGIAALPKSLTKVNIVFGDITPKCFESLAELSNLERLSLMTLEGIKDEDVAKIKHLSKLKTLSIKESSLTAAGLEHISHLTNLEGLILGGRGISDHGLRHLQALKKLKQLFLYNTRTTKGGLDQLRKDIWGPEGKAAFVALTNPKPLTRRTSTRRTRR